MYIFKYPEGLISVSLEEYPPGTELIPRVVVLEGVRSSEQTICTILHFQRVLL
jgi:hypothetical protein